jgi:acyl-CoA reductase-like NAD-dependent aldehyde dehydrogenase
MQHFNNGEFVGSHGRDVVEARNPTNNELIGRVTIGDAVDAEQARKVDDFKSRQRLRRLVLCVRLCRR